MKTSRVKIRNTLNVETTKNLKPRTTYSTPVTKNEKPQPFPALDQS